MFLESSLFIPKGNHRVQLPAGCQEAAVKGCFDLTQRRYANMAADRKERAAKINRLADFIEKKSEIKFPRFFILNSLFDFGRMYDLDALLRCFDWAQDNHESDARVLETIMHDLNGIKQDPETFSPRSSGY
jgi:hypothetical protein